MVVWLHGEHWPPLFPFLPLQKDRNSFNLLVQMVNTEAVVYKYPKFSFFLSFFFFFGHKVHFERTGVGRGEGVSFVIRHNHCVAVTDLVLWQQFTVNEHLKIYENSYILKYSYSPSILHLRDKYELSIDQLPAGLIAQLVRSQRSWVRFPFKPEFFQVSSFQPLRLRHLHCDDLHTIILVYCEFLVNIVEGFRAM